MVSKELVVKIGDFGLAREIYTSDYYRKGDQGLLPVRWMSPEALRDGVFSKAGDVWSFGIVLWEMVTLAELPYRGLSNAQVQEAITSGRTMDRPRDCPERIYEIMRDCWAHYESQRPSFLDICERLMPMAADDRFKEKSWFNSEAGSIALKEQEKERREQREREEAEAEARLRAMEAEDTPCLAGNGNSGHSGNGDYSGGERAGGNNGQQNVRFQNENSGGSISGYVTGSNTGTGNVNIDINGHAYRPPNDMRGFNQATTSGGRQGQGGIQLGEVIQYRFNGLVQRFRNKSGSTSGGEPA